MVGWEENSIEFRINKIFDCANSHQKIHQSFPYCHATILVIVNRRSLDSKTIHYRSEFSSFCIICDYTASNAQKIFRLTNNFPSISWKKRKKNEKFSAVNNAIISPTSRRLHNETIFSLYFHFLTVPRSPLCETDKTGELEMIPHCFNGRGWSIFFFIEFRRRGKLL